MSIGSVSSNAPPAVQNVPEAAEVKKAGPDHDGDADDRKGVKPAQAATAAGPSVNLQGQVTGQNISVRA